MNVISSSSMLFWRNPVFDAVFVTEPPSKRPEIIVGFRSGRDARGVLVDPGRAMHIHVDLRRNISGKSFPEKSMALPDHSISIFRSPASPELIAEAEAQAVVIKLFSRSQLRLRLAVRRLPAPDL
jgi:hypothetical protein